MNASDRDELSRLFESMSNDTLTDEDERRLYELLEQSPEARKLWFLFNDLEIGLEGWAAGQRAREEQAGIERVLHPKIPDRRESVSRGDRAGASPWWRLPAAALVLLVIGLMAAYVFVLRPRTSTSPSGPIATIESVSGDVEVVDAAGHVSPASPDSALFCGQTLRTLNDDSRANVVLSGGTRMILTSKTCVNFVSADGKEGTCVHLDNGMLKVRAEKRHSEVPVVFTTGHARLTVLGTQFRLYAGKEISRIELEEGRVEAVRLADQQTMMLDEGWSVTATADEDPSSFKPQPLPATNSRLRHTFVKAGEGVVFSSDGKLLATAGRVKGLSIWDMSDGNLKHSVRVDGGTSCGPAFTSDERTLVNLGSLGNVSIWRIGSESASCTELDDRQDQSRRVSSDGRWLVFGRRHKNDIAVWAVDAENETISLRRSFNVPGRVWSVAVTSGENPLVAYSKWDGTVFVCDVASERVIYQTNLPHTASLVSLSDDGRYLAAYSHAGLVLVDLPTRTTKEIWGEDSPEVRYLGFSAEGDLLLAGLGDGTARGWDVVDGRAVMIVDADNEGIVGVALSRDRSLVATVAGGHVKIWECDLTEEMANTNQSD